MTIYYFIKETTKTKETIRGQKLTPLRSHHSIMLAAGGTGLDTALSPGPWTIWPAVAWAIGTLLGVPGADAGEAAFDPMNDTGVLQPEGGCEPIWGTEPGFIDTGAGEAEAEGGLEPACWLLPAIWEYQKEDIKFKFENSQKGKSWNDSFRLYSKWFEPGSISSSYTVIVRVRVVLKRTVIGDWRFDNLSGGHLQSQVNSFCQSMMF